MGTHYSDARVPWVATGLFKSEPGIILQQRNVSRGTPRDCGSPSPGSTPRSALPPKSREITPPRSAGILVRKGRIPHDHPFFSRSGPGSQKSLILIPKSVQEPEFPYFENEYNAVDINQ